MSADPFKTVDYVIYDNRVDPEGWKQLMALPEAQELKRKHDAERVHLKQEYSFQLVKLAHKRGIKLLPE